MIRRELVLVALIALLVLGLQSVMQPPVAADRGGKPPFVANEVLVNFQPGVSTADIATFYAKYGLLEMERLGAAPGDVSTLRLARAKPGKMTDTDGFIRALERDLRVEYAELNYILTTALHTPNLPDDTSYGELWGLNNTGQSGGTPDADIDAAEAWHDFTTGSSSVIVGVIDTGVNYNHPDLVNNIWTNQIELNGIAGADDDNNGYIDDIHGYNAYGNNGDPMDDNGHGSHTAGTIGAEGNNSLGVVGVNWDVSIAACKFLSASGSGSTADAIQCFDYFNKLRADGHNVVVTNNSWGGGGFSQALMDAMAGDPAKRILHAAAAGNGDPFTGIPIDNDFTPHYPSSYNLDNIISVAATDHDDNYAGFSNYGKFSVDLAAPGVSILSTVLSSGYSTKNGTSMATPHVAGAAALIWAEYPNLTATNVKALILTGVDGLGGGDKTVTNGRLNVYDAINAMEIDPNPPGEVIDLDVSGSGMSSLTLSWKASGDDGMTGTASSYDIRYSTTPINIDNWALASQATGEPTPLPPNSPQSFTICGLDSDTTYHAGLRVIDNVGNESDISVGSDATWVVTVPTELHDDMENCQAEWTADGLWHKSNHQSNSPNTAWYYGIEGAWNYSTGAINSGTLTTAVDLTGATGGDLTFSYWREVEYWSTGNYDRTSVEVSYDGDGGPWTPVWQMDSSDPSQATWKQASVPLNPGMVNIRFSFNTVDNQFNTSEGWYVDDVHVTPTGSPPPTVTSLNPTSGPTAGGNSVVITGTNLTGATVVTFGGVAASSFTVDSPTQITAVVPAQAAGMVKVLVNPPGGTSVSTVADDYTYVAPPPAPTVPGAPTNAVATAGDGQATVNWDAPVSDGGSAITSYTVTSDPVGPTATTATLSATVTGLTNDTSYTFTVTATNAVGAGPTSTASNAVTPTAALTVPSAPTNAVATAGDAEATVTWQAPVSDGGSPITSYTVTSDPVGPTATTPDGSTLTATVTGLTNGIPYTFTVTATNAVGAGPASTPSNAVTPIAAPTVPSAPTNVVATAGDGQATVTWDAPVSDGGSAITSYTVTSDPVGPTATTPDGSTLTATVTDLANGTSYTFTVMATNAVGAGSASTPSNSVTPTAVPTVPGTSTNAVATAGDSQATVTWDAPVSDGGSAITSYTVTSDPGGPTATTPDGSTLTATVTGLTNGASYTFTVTATNAVGASPASTSSNAVTPTAPLPPTTTTMHVGNLNGASTKLKKGQWSGQVTVKVDTAAHSGVVGATVWGFFSQNGWTSILMDCTTVLGGTCTIDSGPLQKKSGSATFTVDSVTHATLTYDSTGNHDPDVDSFIAADGTISIELSK